MELHAVQPSLHIGDSGIFTVRRVRRRDKSGRKHADLVCVAHKPDLIGIKPIEYLAGGIDLHLCSAVLADIAGGNRSAGGVSHKLNTVAYAGIPQSKSLGSHFGEPSR